MAENLKTYHFSKFALLIAFFLILIVSVAVTIILMGLYYNDALIGMLLTIPLLLIIIEPMVNFTRFTYYLILKRPALIVSTEKLIDNIHKEVLYWEDIALINLHKEKSLGAYILIEVKDPEKFTRKQNNPYNRVIRKLNHKYFGGMFSIKSSLLRCNSQELYKTLSEAQSRQLQYQPI